MKTALQVRAARFARDAHKGQNRKYTGLPYIHHPMQVALLTNRFITGPWHDEAVAAAWLHDTVEDCGVKLKTIDEAFGGRVAEYVFWLTDVSKKDDGNREFRKTLDRWHMSGAPAEAQTIKLADMADNCLSITKHDPDFARVYMKEKKALLQILTKGSPLLHAYCEGLVQQWEQEQLDEALRPHAKSVD